MSSIPGVYIATKKDGTIYYRSSITIQNKHISLGSFPSQELAHKVYKEAHIIYNSNIDLSDYNSRQFKIPFKKYVCLINFRDNKIYFKTPIYLHANYFTYYIGRNTFYTFDVDDLFYYSTHSIMKRGGHLFVADYGMQVNILTRYGIKDYAVEKKDFYFANGNPTDYRYENIIVINPYHGVEKYQKNGQVLYKAKIHINGDFIIGSYSSPEESAIAYNKAADILKKNGCKKSFPENYPESLSAKNYASIYHSIKISHKIKSYNFK